MAFLETAAHEEARHWLAPQVLRGDSVKAIAEGQGGRWNRHVHIQLGGYAFYKDVGHRLEPRQVAITRLGGIDCLFVFELVELSEEILHPEPAVEQISLY